MNHLQVQNQYEAKRWTSAEGSATMQYPSIDLSVRSVVCEMPRPRNFGIKSGEFFVS